MFITSSLTCRQWVHVRRGGTLRAVRQRMASEAE